VLSRITYALRETKASFQRNLTLTAAAIVTSAVSLLLAGSTFLIQHAFDNLVLQWKDGVEVILFLRPDVTQDQIDYIEAQLNNQPNVVDVDKLRYLTPAESYQEAKRIFAGDPSTLRLLNEQNTPAQIKVVPSTDDAGLLRSMDDVWGAYPGVRTVTYAQDTVDIVSRVSNFIRVATTTMSVVLLTVAVGLIWNTIRTAMFARRREIEVMKLVGATNWFIRIPFMLEGLLQGMLGGVMSCVGLWALNTAWTNRVRGFNDTELAALVVSPGYVRFVMILMLIIGALAGAIGSGIAATRFLDV